MGNTVNDRELILEILLAVTRDGEYSHIALRNVLENYQYLDKSERAFITRVTEGTLERMIEFPRGSQSLPKNIKLRMPRR